MRRDEATPRHRGAVEPFVLLAALCAAVAAMVPLQPPLHAQTVLAAAPSAGVPGVAADVAVTTENGRPAPGVGPEGSLDAKAKRTRFVVGTDRKVKYSVFSLSNPNRVIIEMGDGRLDLPSMAGGQPMGLVKSFRGGLSAPGRQRVVIDVTAPVVVAEHTIAKSANGQGYQISIDIVPAQAAMGRNQTAALGQPAYRLGVQPPLPRPAETPDKRAARAFKPIIVIDPGHGGHDSGALKYGTVEKDVVLAFSHILKEKLEATGRYKILMTRETDVFVELDARRAYAERHNASLFIAVHADYASTSARGATIYTLRNGVADQLKRSAKDDAAEHVLSKQEISGVRGASGDVDAVKGILTDLARRDIEMTQQRTSMFARSIVNYMSNTTNMRDDPDKQAAFRVLKTAQFPSVLIELAYVSNRQDAALLKSDAWRNKVANSISTAVENYFSHQIARLPL